MINHYLKPLLLFMLLLCTSAAFAFEQVTYYHNDALGSPIAASDSEGNILWRESYQPYGERQQREPRANANRRWFTSHVEDADTGLLYMQARYYDPRIGRFMSMDPVGFVASNPMSFNRYLYVNNNPYKYVDPDGEFLVIGAIIGAAVEVGAQLITNGGDFSSLDVSDIVVAGAVGFVTGGVGSVLAKSAAKGAISVSNAITATASVGGTVGGVGVIVAGELNGKFATPLQVIAGVLGGGFGAAAGAKIATNYAKTIEKGFGVYNSHIASATKSAMIGKQAITSTSLFERVGEVTAEAASNLGQKRYNEIE